LFIYYLDRTQGTQENITQRAAQYISRNLTCNNFVSVFSRQAAVV